MKVFFAAACLVALAGRADLAAPIADEGWEDGISRRPRPTA
jgi:hypothetical protein